METGLTQVPSDVVLAHYGVKGMKWGKRKNPLREAKKERRAVVRETKDAMRNERDRNILNARDRIENSRSNLKDAKQQYKTDRKEIGRNAAKAALVQARTKELPTLMRDSDTAMMRTAKEQQQDMLVDIGATLVRLAIG